jgi:hypothetical protein
MDLFSGATDAKGWRQVIHQAIEIVVSEREHGRVRMRGWTIFHVSLSINLFCYICGCENDLVFFEK